MDMLQDVVEFHQKYKLDAHRREPGARVSDQLITFRLKFLLEELTELNVALGKQDLPEALDALVDLVYVALGTAYLLDLPFKEAWYQVHAANMQKRRASSAEQSKRGTQLDVVKPVGWRSPDHSFLLHDADLALKTSAEPTQLSLLDLLQEVRL